MSAIPVTVPLINPNEPEAVLAAVHVQPGQHVSAGDLLFTLETTKSAADVTAESSGYVAGLHFSAGSPVSAGAVLCYLAGAPDWAPPEPEAAAPDEGGVPEGLRITQPALTLARLHSLDLSRLPRGQMVTESMVRALLEQAQKADRLPGADFSLPPAPFDPTAIIVFGAGGHGKSLIDLLRALGSYQIAGVVDDRYSGEAALNAPPVLGLPVLGGSEALADLHRRGVRLAVNAVGGIGNIAVRIRIFRRLAEAGFACPAVVHPTAFVEPSAVLLPGAQIFPHAYAGSQAQVGYGVIVNTGAIVSHDCILGDYTNVSPGAMLAGEVQVGAGVLIGMGVTVNLQVKIGAGARIGNGATVKADVPAGGIVRAGTIWPE